MILIRCPYCRELRTEEELTQAGEAGVVRPPDPARVSDAEWTDYLYMRSNGKGIVAEQWCCTFGCGQWFVVWRDTVTHAIHDVKPIPVAARRQELDEEAAARAAGGL